MSEKVCPENSVRKSRWKKLGLVFAPQEEGDKEFVGARLPVPMQLDGTRYRIYFGYDGSGDGRSEIHSVEIDLKNPSVILEFFPTAHLSPGDPGFFDDNGVLPSDIVRVGSKIYLYTVGFSVKNRLIFDAAPGLAISEDGGQTFLRFNGPVLDRSIYDPCFTTAPTVKRERETWRMWYVSCERWSVDEGGAYRHHYNIKHRSSSDGLNWSKENPKTCIDFANETEYAIARPSVVFEGGLYRMWYSFREQEDIKTYRIGYAESADGLNWARQDNKAGIDVSEDGWDSEMICYPSVFRHENDWYMLYNGNGYGRSGFGLAIWD